MIESTQQFISLRTSENPEDYNRAAHEEAPTHVWQDLIESHPDMRFWVAQNKTVPIAILRSLAGDEDSRVRHMVASKRTLPADLQLLLARDPDKSVRNALVHNSKVTDEALQILSSDSWQQVSDKAKKRLDS
jgi:hypothetical protein